MNAVVGIDLSGPSNVADTVVVVFRERDGLLMRETVAEGVTDTLLLELGEAVAGDSGPVVGLDAPLSYNPGGGDRPGDSALRNVVREAGLRSGSVMTPTMTRMVYLTLRGMGVARLLELAVVPRPRIVEVHPGATLARRGAGVDLVRTMKSSLASRRTLLRWLEHVGLQGAAEREDPSDHYVAACAAALAAWKWSRNEAVWVHESDPPWHPYDFAL